MLPTRGPDHWETLSRAALSGSATVWLIVTLAGQLVFAAYVANFYGGAAIAGEYERWSKVLPRGIDSTDPLGNAILGLHLLLAVAWVLSGMLQLIPAGRRHLPALHRWNGRLYIGFAAMLAVGGLWLVWIRGGVVGDLAQHLAISINALLILGCAAKAWHAARLRLYSDHRRWALRLFVVASGVWFFRVGLMAWMAVHQRPVGFDADTFQGPFLTLLAFGVYVLLPLSLLQLYLTAKDRGGPTAHVGVTAVIGIVTLATCIGTFAAAMGMWLPRMSL
ncbi:DUF2306 domain-containing protein [Piscinibacter sp.]|uniref:DUF2306 domain-containing protein n=1 Tax=Piscinibacter sp. TaxID=1903157 RepID=UPI0011D7C919|nr:MAG: DUF2306 domain-containing protein [Burkholderiaceae bacterium]